MASVRFFISEQKQKWELNEFLRKSPNSYKHYKLSHTKPVLFSSSGEDDEDEDGFCLASATIRGAFIRRNLFTQVKMSR